MVKLTTRNTGEISAQVEQSRRRGRSDEAEAKHAHLARERLAAHSIDSSRPRGGRVTAENKRRLAATAMRHASETSEKFETFLKSRVSRT